MPTRSSRLCPRCLARFGVWFIAGLVLLPVLVVVWRALEPAGEMWPQIVRNRLAGYLWQSAVLIVGVTFLAILFGVPAAWHVSVHDFPGRRIFEWALLLPLAMPGFVAALAYLDAVEGLIPFYVWIREHFGLEVFLLSQKITPWIFATGILAATLFPYVFLSCRGAFAREAAGSLEAARMLGAGNLRTFLTVAAPMARPAIAAGASLVAMETINDYGVVSAFGLQPLTPGIFRAWTEGYPGAAMRLAVILMAMALLFVSVERWQRGRRRFASDSAETPLARRRLRPAGALWAWTVCLLPLLLGFLIPAWRMLRWALHSPNPVEWAEHAVAAGNSLMLAAGSALLIILGAVVLVGSRRAFAGRSTFLAQRMGLLGYAFPSALVAVGVGAIVSTLSAQPGLGVFALSASVLGLIYAYFVRFLAVGIQPAAAGFETVSSSLHEAARTLGARPLRALLQVDLPLVRPALAAGATLAFIDVFKELTLTLVLRPFDFETLATRIYRLTGESRIPDAAAPGLFMVLISLIGLAPLTRLLRREPWPALGRSETRSRDEEGRGSNGPTP
ncbi:MAG TPA: iron ABC transporter permease [Verrucomicrobiales bacterium]|nr:iron ABC transporter permease [Verrucomicrobiales bacterium]